jgi:NADH:ubiquinone oxidoreductase subunit 5 (subunit L)/multisubunit Na+/H+ antiporter MnhA subunit
MLCVCGLGGYSLGFHHLLIHGFFKALLFLAGGVLIHRLNGEQDIRKMGGLIEYTPLTFSYFLIGFSSLIGLPATAGFSSKERLLDFISGYDSDVAFTCYSLLWLALVGTSFYSVKTFFYVFFGEFRGSTAVKKSLKLSKSSQEANFFLIFFLGGLILIIFNAEELYQPYTNALDSFFLQSSGISQKASLLPILSETFASPNRLLPFSAIFFGFFIFFGSEHFSYTILSKNFFQSETLFSSYIIKKTYFVFQQSL